MAKVSREHRRWLVLAFAALGLRATGAILRQPWHDEYFTVWLANGSWPHMLDALRLDSGPPLLYAASNLLAVTWAWERLNQIIMRQRGTLGLVLAVAPACWSHAFGLIVADTLALAALGHGRGAEVANATRRCRWGCSSPPLGADRRHATPCRNRVEGAGMARAAAVRKAARPVPSGPLLQKTSQPEL